MTATEPITTIDGPAAWYGRDLAGSDDWIERLSEADVHELRAGYRAVADAGGHWPPSSTEGEGSGCSEGSPSMR
jgi:hypothetical protein